MQLCFLKVRGVRRLSYCVYISSNRATKLSGSHNRNGVVRHLPGSHWMQIYPSITAALYPLPTTQLDWLERVECREAKIGESKDRRQ